ncbi:recombinase family protein [Rhizobium redzepovicii]
MNCARPAVSAFKSYGSGASRARPALTKLLKELAAGDALVVVRLDRLARSVSHLLESRKSPLPISPAMFQTDRVPERPRGRNGAYYGSRPSTRAL